VKIICTFRLLVALLLIAFILGMAAGLRVAADVSREQVTVAVV
jgi:hypothetical protein